ncbi:MAG: hypothetical protein ACFE9Q_15685 [Candidatus Hodarchaeota archaeon]
MSILVYVSKYTSYYDWELRFRDKKAKRIQKRKNTLRLYHHQFEQFLQEWKKKNFPLKEKKKDN